MFFSDRMAVSCLYFALLCVSYLGLGHCQTTAPPSNPCSAYRTCDTCVPHAQCLWCFTSSNCTDYPVRWLMPPASVCPLSQARWGVCWMNFEALIIVLAVLCGTVIISIIICCCCCCCCCKRRSSRPHRDEESSSRRREEIRQRSEERKVERKARHDEIRRKYGCSILRHLEVTVGRLGDTDIKSGWRH